MPIALSVPFKHLSRDEFHLLDYRFMKETFSVQKEFGRFCNEEIYKNELAHRCRLAGFDTITTEVPIRVSYQGFVKVYYIDLLLNDGLMVELKAVQALDGQHRKQAINYLLLVGLRYSTLVNLGSPSVQRSFVSTTLAPEDRYDYTINDSEWTSLDGESEHFKTIMMELLADWGAFLDTTLYQSAATYFLGGEDKVIRNIEAASEGRILGTQVMHMLNSDVAFTVCASTKGCAGYREHLRRLLALTSLKAIQMVNLDHHTITFVTITHS